VRRSLWVTCCVLAVAAGAPGLASAQLTTFGYGNARLGSAPAGDGISPASATRLRTAWRAQLPGAILGQPLVVRVVRIGRSVRDLVLVGTGRGVIAALDAASGRLVWRHRVGARRIMPDCEASPDGWFGVTGTMVIDPDAGTVYAADARGMAWALSLVTGRPLPGWPVRFSSLRDNFEWGALALSGGRLYIPVASLCDAGHYNGGIVAIDVRKPRRSWRWRTEAGTSAYAGGIWGWGGVSIDGRGQVYAATGNSLGSSREDAGYAESVVRLSPTLLVQDANDPLRPPFKIGDRDFGTTPVLLDEPGCPPQLVAINKDGELFRYDRARLSSGPVQRIAVAGDSPGHIPLYGVPAFDPISRMLVLVSPTSPPGSVLHGGVQAFAMTSSCTLKLRWQAHFDPPNAGSAPTIADGVVYIGSGRNGWLRAYRLSDGRQLWGRRLSRSAIFAAPAVDGGRVFEGDWLGQVWALRPGSR
jgi:outer membrane protein assembly factor BamB